MNAEHPYLRLYGMLLSQLLFFALLFSSMSRVSMEKPQMNWPGRRWSPRYCKTSLVLVRGMLMSPSCFFTLSPLYSAGV